MRSQPVYSRLGAVLAITASVVALWACGAASSVTVTTGATVSPTSGRAPTATTSAPPAHAFAWTQYDTSSVPQVWASLNGAAPVQITHFAIPGGAVCDSWQLWSPPVFSPDYTHILAAIGGAQCGDGPWYGPPSVIAVAGGAITTVPGSNTGIRISQRTSGWIDDHTIYFANGAGLWTYSLGAAAPSQLPGVASAEEAELRGTTLFYATVSYGSTVISETLHRYDLTSHTVLPGSISLGQYNSCQCSPGNYPTLGWDVSRDGSHVVYQVATSGGSASGFSMGSSHVWYANADGSGATPIAQALSSASFLQMQISPNGALVAMTSSTPPGAVVTASVTSAGLPGDPNYHSYSPDALQFPVWKWDSSQFWAATQFSAPSTPSGSIYNYPVGAASGVVGVAGGYNPWYTLG